MPFRTPGSFYPLWFRGWNRLESRSRHKDFAQGLQAATADGYWMLGRQLQLKELKGEDAGTPIQVTLRAAEAHMGSIKLGGDPWTGVTQPMEVLVEREYVKWDWRLRVRAGQQFERLMRAHTPAVSEATITQLRTMDETTIKMPTSDAELQDMDLATRRFVQFAGGRSIDGKKLLEVIDTATVSAILDANLRQAIKDWRGTLYSEVPDKASPAWQPERLDYEFSIRSRPPAAAALYAGSYRNGTIDWNTFQVTNSNLVARPLPTLQLTPAHATFAGQPMRRWWEFEDYAVNFGELDTATTDIAKMLLTEYALVFGDDWFVVPLRATPNSLVSVLELKVRDCFGQETSIQRAVDASTNEWQRWEVFALSPKAPNGQTSQYIYVPPIVGVREEGPALEEVRFARDEGANCVFAIEQTVPNQMGDPVGGYAAHLEAQRRWRERPRPSATSESSGATTIDAATGTTAPEAEAAPEPTSTPPSPPPLDPPKLRFVLGTRVPRNWIPFIATDKNAGTTASRKVRLRRAEIVSTEPEDELLAISGLSRLLSDGSASVEWLNEEAVGRAGVRVELRRQRMRTADGKTYVWLGRKVGVGTGEVRSGLRHDVVKDT